MVAGVASIGPIFREIRESAKAMEESQRQLQSIMDHTPAAVYVKDTNGRYLLSNRYVTKVLRREAGELLGKTDTDIMPAAIAEAIQRNDAQVLAERQPIEFDEPVTHADGYTTTSR